LIQVSTLLVNYVIPSYKISTKASIRIAILFFSDKYNLATFPVTEAHSLSNEEGFVLHPESSEFTFGQDLANVPELPPAPPLPENLDLPRAEPDFCSDPKRSPLLAYHLGRSRYLSLNAFKGNVKVHIRLFPRNRLTNNLYPTVSGVCLDHIQTRSLMHYLGQIRAAMILEDQSPIMNWHLGLFTFASINPTYGLSLDIRHFFVPKNETRLQATRRGIRLSRQEVDNLTWALHILEQNWDQLRNYPVPCFEEHSNDMTNWCVYCNPSLQQELGIQNSTSTNGVN